MLEINPTVSMYTAFILHGKSPPWAVTSSVANKRFSGIMSLSPVNALIRVVLPETGITGQSSNNKPRYNSDFVTTQSCCGSQIFYKLYK